MGYISSSLLSDSYNTEYLVDVSPSSIAQNNNLSSTIYKYVNAQKVNIRIYPSATSEVLTTMNWNQSIKTYSTYDNWTLVEFLWFNSYSNTYENKLGYIKASLLSSKYNMNYPDEFPTTTSTQPDATNEYVVTSRQAFFHNMPDSRTIRAAYLLEGEKISSLKESKYYVYIVFTNTNNQTSRGWIRKDNLEAL